MTNYSTAKTVASQKTKVIFAISTIKLAKKCFVSWHQKSCLPVLLLFYKVADNIFFKNHLEFLKNESFSSFVL